MDDKDRLQIPEWRRRRIERLKKYIRFFYFVRRNVVRILCVTVVVFSVTAGTVLCFGYRKAAGEQREQLSAVSEGSGFDSGQPADGDIGTAGENLGGQADPDGENYAPHVPEILEKYQTLYGQNGDLAGWLSIEGTVIDYPVMQTPEDEEYYLRRDFYGNYSNNGCLIMDTDSVVGVGTAAENYVYLNEAGEVCETRPGTNLIIHGHTMKSGEMFGQLQEYKEESYWRDHDLICFDSLYEHRKYKVAAAFYSQVYYEDEIVFKYYKFFQAATPDEFSDWYENIKALSLYDTGVKAEFGDEFITLSCCAYHVENGRFVVVGKRVE